MSADSSFTAKPVFQPAPGPKPSWIGGNITAFNRDPLNFLTRCVHEYGDLVELRFAGHPVFVLGHPTLIEEVLVKKNKSFVKGRGLARTREVLGNGLLTSEGEFWRRQRRLAQPAFHQQRLLHYSETMARRTLLMLAGWHPGQNIDVHEAMMDLTMQIVAEALFGAEISSQTSVVSQAMTVMLDNFSQRNRQLFIPEGLPTPARKRFREAVARLDAVVYGIIHSRREDRLNQDDLLDMLLSARDESGNGMTDQQLRDEVMTLFLAGHETTANALSWSWMLLAQNPECAQKLHTELDQVLAGRDPTVSDLPQLPYTQWVIAEALRLYPPAWIIGRQAIHDVEIAGVTLPEGAGVIMSQWVLHRDQRFFEQPQAFMPERWQDDFARHIPDFAYFPFGGGPRLCIGRSFALMEAALVFAMTAQRFHLQLLPDQVIQPRPSITLRPGRGVWVTLKTR